MTTSETPICSICRKPVVRETSNKDEVGKAVHHGCYILKVRSQRPTPPPEQS